MCSYDAYRREEDFEEVIKELKDYLHSKEALRITLDYVKDALIEPNFEVEYLIVEGKKVRIVDANDMEEV